LTALDRKSGGLEKEELRARHTEEERALGQCREAEIGKLRRLIASLKERKGRPA
jgi:hypothetical protein